MWKYVVVVALAVAVGLGLGLQIGGEGAGAPVAPASGSAPPAGDGQRKIAYWRAPMNPSYTADKPGKSPMGMDLIPVYEDELGQAGTVKIDPVTVQNIGVKTAVVQRQALRRRVRTVGRVDYDETLMSDVNTKIAGWVEKLYVDYTGQEVTRGQPLLEIYSPELVAAQEEYLTALDYHARLRESASQDVVRGAADLLRAAVQRLRYWDVTDAQIATLKRTRQVRRTMTVYSPQEGIVVHKAVYDGQHIDRGQHLYRIADLSRVWVYADVYEYELPWVKTGQDATVDLSYLPGTRLSGTVTYIYPFLDKKTRTVKVRTAFDNRDRLLKPDMYANVVIESAPVPEAIVVPVQAVIHSGERNVAVVSLGEGRFQPRDVELGLEADGLYQVLDGLREGERIVTSAQFLIDSESNLKAAVSAMASPEEEEGGAALPPAQGMEGMEGMQGMGDMPQVNAPSSQPAQGDMEGMEGMQGMGDMQEEKAPSSQPAGDE